jgi:uncharacterized membrane protein
MNFRHETYRKTALAGLAALALVAAMLFGAAPSVAAGTIPLNAKFNVTLASSDINTKNAQPGDQFTMNAIAPYPNGNSKYAGAVVYGHVASARSAGQGRTAQLNLVFDKIVLADGEVGQLSASMISAHTVSENTTARKALGAGAGMAVGSQTIGRIIGGSAGAVVGMLGGAAGGYAYANNQKANFNLAKGAQAVVETTAPVHVRPQAR